VLGLAVSLCLSVAIYRLGIRVNMKRFFTVLGAGLMIVAAGLLANAIQNLQELSVLPGGSQTLWNTSRFVSDDSNLGDVLHGIFGYASSPSLLQVSAWAVFLVIGLRTFLSASPPTQTRAQAGTTGTTTSA
jgi:high-affinity iron transporter